MNYYQSRKSRYIAYKTIKPMYTKVAINIMFIAM